MEAAVAILAVFTGLFLGMLPVMLRNMGNRREAARKRQTPARVLEFRPKTHAAPPVHR